MKLLSYPFYRDDNRKNRGIKDRYVNCRNHSNINKTDKGIAGIFLFAKCIEPLTKSDYIFGKIILNLR